MPWRRETTLPHRPELAEWLDTLALDPATLAGNLRDIRRLNRLLGWERAVAADATALLAAGGAGGAPTILDLGCGSGDLPLAVGARLRRAGGNPRFLCVDLHPPILRIARRQIGAAIDAEYLCADGLRLPLPDRAVDLVLCSATLHHFPPADAARLLRELGRIARGALLVSDLARDRSLYFATRAATTLALRNRATRHDGVVSVLRAYTASEVRQLAAEAGLAGATVRARRPWRLALAWVREQGTARSAEVAISAVPGAAPPKTL